MAGLAVASMRLKHTHPYTLEELNDLDTNHISEGQLESPPLLYFSADHMYPCIIEILRLQKSIQMLQSTNATLFDSISLSSSSSPNSEDTLSEEDSRLFQETIQENEEAILAQKERIEMCIYTLKKRLGVDPTNKHYDLNYDTTAITARDVTPPESHQQQESTTTQEANALHTQQSQLPQSQEETSQGGNHVSDEQGGMYL